jgi:hypothetical protein
MGWEGERKLGGGEVSSPPGRGRNRPDAPAQRSFGQVGVWGIQICCCIRTAGRGAAYMLAAASKRRTGSAKEGGRNVNAP